MPTFMQEQSVIQRRLSPRARSLTLEIAAEARAEWGFATEIVARAFRERRDLASGDRRLVAETVYGLVRWERRLEAIVDEMLASLRGRPQPVSVMGRQELKLLVYELRDGIPADALKADARRIIGRDLDLAAAAADDAGLAGRTGLDREHAHLAPEIVDEVVVDEGLVRVRPDQGPIRISRHA
jgi:hypothetical protein